MDVRPGVNGIQSRCAGGAPGSDRLHHLQRGRLPVEQGRGAGHGHGMQPVAVQLGDCSQRGEVPLQDGRTAEVQAAWGVGNPQGLQRAGISQAMALLGANRFVRLADDRQAVDQPPVVRRGEREGKRVFIPAAGLPFHEPAGDRAAGRPRAAPRQAGKLALAERQTGSARRSQCQRGKGGGRGGDPGAHGEIIFTGYLRAIVHAAQAAHLVEEFAHPRERLPLGGRPVEDQRVGGEFETELDAGAGVQPFQVDRDRAVGREVQVGVAVAPVFD